VWKPQPHEPAPSRRATRRIHRLPGLDRSARTCHRPTGLVGVGEAAARAEGPVGGEGTGDGKLRFTRCRTALESDGAAVQGCAILVGRDRHGSACLPLRRTGRRGASSTGRIRTDDAASRAQRPGRRAAASPRSEDPTRGAAPAVAPCCRASVASLRTEGRPSPHSRDDGHVRPVGCVGDISGAHHRRPLDCNDGRRHRRSAPCATGDDACRSRRNGRSGNRSADARRWNSNAGRCRPDRVARRRRRCLEAARHERPRSIGRPRCFGRGIGLDERCVVGICRLVGAPGYG